MKEKMSIINFFVNSGELLKVFCKNSIFSLDASLCLIHYINQEKHSSK